MEFGFNEEQTQLRAQVRRFLDSECPLDRVREVMAADDPLDRPLWNKAAELGWQALVIPEAHGGLGLKWEDLIVVAEETGRSLFPSPLLATAAAARAIDEMGRESQKEKYLPLIASGELVATIAVLEETDDPREQGVQLAAETVGEQVTLSGRKMFVPWAQAAGLILVAAREADGVSLFAVPADAPGLTVRPLPLVDQTSRAAELEFEAVTLEPGSRLGEPGGAWRDLQKVLDAWVVALSGEMVGAADAAVTLAVEYAKVRKQFGELIGKFQGVKHRLAELHVAVESARSLVYYASWAVDNADDAARHASMAKAHASVALDEAGEDGIQLHGAIGYTWECDAHLYYKRGRYCRNLMGSPEYHNERLLAGQGL